MSQDNSQEITTSTIEEFNDKNVWDNDYDLFDKFFMSLIIKNQHIVVNIPNCENSSLPCVNFEECVQIYKKHINVNSTQ